MDWNDDGIRRGGEKAVDQMRAEGLGFDFVRRSPLNSVQIPARLEAVDHRRARTRRLCSHRLHATFRPANGAYASTVAQIREAAAELEIPLIEPDIPSEGRADGVHLNPAGYVRWLPAVTEGILRECSREKTNCDAVCASGRRGALGLVSLAPRAARKEEQGSIPRTC
jgi:lysophospholipase L1-like esterase